MKTQVTIIGRDPSGLLLWGAKLSRTPTTGYTACCAAITGADLSDATVPYVENSAAFAAILTPFLKEHS
ncbi:MAG: hypothetical protein ABJF50_01850 [Paracoccaceae bacterium]